VTRTTTDDAKTILSRYVAAVEAGDAETIRDSFAESATWTLAGEMPISGTWEGRNAIIDEFLATAMSNYEPGSVNLEITGMIAEGDRVALQWTSRARTLDGQPYENDCIGVFTVSDGKIQSVREYMDTHYAFKALARVSSAE
jgi:ketosteroid isomerase-like protein